MTVAGDQWPVLLYEDGAYDPNDPWNGLFRSKLLVWVSTAILQSQAHAIVTHSHTDVLACRRSSISSLHPVQWKRKPKQPGQATLAYME
jgi:hypothetical protein